MTHRRALVIATENYRSKKFSRLPGTAKDADDLRQVLGDPRVGDFKVTVLRDATVRNAGLAIRKFFSQARPDDLLLLHISGHGIRDSDGDLYFVNRDTRPDALWATALAANDVRREIRNSRARCIVVLLDCCYAGAFGRAEDPLADAVPDLPTRPAAPSTPRSPHGHTRRARGQVVIAAATSVEQATEAGSGLFTQSVVRGLSSGAADADGDGEIDAAELYEYVCARMSALRAGQNPTYFAHLQGKLRIAHNPLASARTIDQSDDEEDRDDEWAEVGSGREPRGPFPRRVRVALLAAVGLLAGCTTQADSKVVGDGCPTPVQLRVAAAPAGLAAYRELATEFERWVAEQRHGCRSAALHVYPVTAEDLVEGLRHDWEQGPGGKDYLRDVGPHPDVWLPAAALEVPPDAGPIQDVIDRVVPLAETPIVLGVPERAEVAAPRRGDLSWPDLFEAVSRGAGAVRGDFATSVVARMATAGLYRNGTIDAVTARTRFEQPIERDLDKGRYPVGDEAELLCRRRTAGDDTAVIVTEQELVRFNAGAPADGRCLGAGRPENGDRLLAFYADGAPTVRQVAVTLTWTQRAQTTGAAAYGRWFASWLRETPGRAALLRAGWRPFTYDVAEPVGRGHGALADWPFSHAAVGEPNALTRRDVAELHAGARRVGRFLVALDASGSMNAVTTDPDRTRFEVSVGAIEQAVGRLGPRDEFGLLTFAGAGTRTVLPVARNGADPVARVRRATGTLKPAGGTPLYEAIRRGADTLRAGAGAGEPLRTLVVLTDGKDTSGQPRPSAAQTAGVRVLVIAVGEATCADPALKRLAVDTAGRCFDAGLDSLEPVLTGMFQAAWDTEEG